MGLGIVGGLLFVGFDTLIALVIWWYVEQERGQPSGISAALFDMRNVNHRDKPRRWPDSQRV